MKTKELITKSDAELKAELTKLYADSDNLVVKLRTNQLKNVHQVRVIKKDIARILTILNSRLSL